MSAWPWTNPNELRHHAEAIHPDRPCRRAAVLDQHPGGRSGGPGAGARAAPGRALQGHAARPDLQRRDQGEPEPDLLRRRSARRPLRRRRRHRLRLHPDQPVRVVLDAGGPHDRDRAARFDFSNIQGIIQKPEGAFQFYIQAGGYSIPQLGFPTLGTFTQTDLLFGPVPVAFGKIQINDDWSLQGGRMFTLIGTELLFTYQNLNINRGLLFVQENFINQGVQVNYAGPAARSRSRGPTGSSPARSRGSPATSPTSSTTTTRSASTAA